MTPVWHRCGLDELHRELTAGPTATGAQLLAWAALLTGPHDDCDLANSAREPDDYATELHGALASHTTTITGERPDSSNPHAWPWTHTHDIAWLAEQGRQPAARRAIRDHDEAHTYIAATIVSHHYDPDPCGVLHEWPQLPLATHLDQLIHNSRDIDEFLRIVDTLDRIDEIRASFHHLDDELAARYAQHHLGDTGPDTHAQQLHPACYGTATSDTAAAVLDWIGAGNPDVRRAAAELWDAWHGTVGELADAARQIH